MSGHYWWLGTFTANGMEEAADHHPISDQAVRLTQLASTTLAVNTYAAFHASAISCECPWIVPEKQAKLASNFVQRKGPQLKRCCTVDTHPPLTWKRAPTASGPLASQCGQTRRPLKNNPPLATFFSTNRWKSTHTSTEWYCLLECQRNEQHTEPCANYSHHPRHRHTSVHANVAHTRDRWPLQPHTTQCHVHSSNCL